MGTIYSFIRLEIPKKSLTNEQLLTVENIALRAKIGYDEYSKMEPDENEIMISKNYNYFTYKKELGLIKKCGLEICTYLRQNGINILTVKLEYN